MRAEPITLADAKAEVRAILADLVDVDRRLGRLGRRLTETGKTAEVLAVVTDSWYEGGELRYTIAGDVGELLLCLLEDSHQNMIEQLRDLSRRSWRALTLEGAEKHRATLKQDEEREKQRATG